MVETKENDVLEAEKEVVAEETSDIDSSRQSEAEADESSEPRLYELGYHIVPTVPEEGVGEEMSKLKDIVERHGGVFAGEEMPRSMQLAYPMSKVVNNKKSTYNTAWFGWMRFQVTPVEAEALYGELKQYETILRFILMKVEQEKKRDAPKKMKFLSNREEKKEDDTATKEKQETKMTDEELDKTIDELVVE